MNHPKTRHCQQSPELTSRAKRDLPMDDEKAIAFTAPFSEKFFPSKPEKPSLVSSSEGALELLLFAIPSYVMENSAYSGIYMELVTKLPEYASLQNKNVRIQYN